MEIKFIVDPDKNKESVFFALYYVKWDDYHHMTTFSLYYHNEVGRVKIGGLKIMHKEFKKTIEVLPKEFHSLSSEYCSLGFDLDYYESLKKELSSDYLLILEALNDAAFLSGIKDEFENTDGFKYSLLRGSSSEHALHRAKSILLNIPFANEFKFDYSCLIKGAEKKHSLSFNFGDKENLPNRIIALIGKNGTGKTQFLANLALDLSGKSRKKLKKDVFIPHRPLFTKVIAISYSIFDKFVKPQSNRSFSYKYCGLKDQNGRLVSNKKMNENFSNSIERIVQKDLGHEWLGMMSKILESNFSKLYYNIFLEKEKVNLLFEKIFNELSSGQSFLVYVLTELMANIKPNSLILFDEPEMHLHPNAIGNLIKTFNDLLKKFDSYALLATHSPLIIQEIPSRYVNVFEREGNIPITYNLGIECFGENIEVLTQEVFKTIDVDKNYKEVLLRLSKSFPYKEVLMFFDNKLSLNAKTYLLGQYKNPELELNA